MATRGSVGNSAATAATTASAKAKLSVIRIAAPPRRASACANRSTATCRESLSESADHHDLRRTGNRVDADAPVHPGAWLPRR